MQLATSFRLTGKFISLTHSLARSQPSLTGAKSPRGLIRLTNQPILNQQIHQTVIWLQTCSPDSQLDIYLA